MENVDNTLRCSCGFRDRFGIGCAHEYHVISQFSNYDEPSHRECSIRWWNIYSNYGICEKAGDKDNHKNIELLRNFHQLQKADLKGLPIPPISEMLMSITNSALIPNEFIPKSFPNCYNYPNLVVHEKDLESNVHCVSGLTQTVSQLGSKHLQSIFDVSVEYDEIDERNVYDDDMRKISPFTELKPYFDDLTLFMEGHCTNENISDIKLFFQKQISLFQKKAYKDLEEKKATKKTMEKRKVASLVSSTIPHSKKKKAHGTNY